jgi:tetratricopeptide (TPR) repeat protein
MKSERLLGWIVLLVCLTLGSCSLGRQEAKVPVTTSSDEARQLFLQGRELLDAGRPAKARSYFVQALGQDSEFALAHLALAEVETTEGERAAALAIAVGFADRVSLGERLMILAVKAGRDGNPTARMKYCRDLVRLYPDDERAQLLLGESYEEQQDHANAIQTYRAVLEVHPELASAYRRLGDVYRALGRYRQAEGALVKYLALNPSEPDPYHNLAELMMKTGRFEESIEHYEKALVLDSDLRSARIGIANNLIFLERPAEAQTTFQELYESAGGAAERLSALLWLAAAQLHQEDHESALAELRKAHALAQASEDAAAQADVLELMGDTLLEAGDADAALSRYTESLVVLEDAGLSEAVKHAARKNHVYHQTRVAIAKRELTTAKSRLKEYRESLQRGTADAKNRFNEMSGLIALAEGDRETAVRLLERAGLQDPRIFYWLALAYRDLGRDNEARKNCRKAADFNAPEIEFAFVRAKARRLLEEI